ncbi:hypothetical protein J2S74_003088 [Evansella vedderi]|uniref:Uncharacterized protein n=1 Tax=Evansella vedderi TaxID=38282 RepID=A0ABT9ZWU7_9BACI|nr:hypothetical protein [Evansella vedderi]MDQ0255706.1 hypothetical protein [Evansella vedderi]
MAREIQVGNEYTISQRIKESYFSAESLRIVSVGDKSVQFILNGSKGRGSMPIQHLYYMVKKNDLTEVINKRTLLEEELSEDEEQIS